MKIYVANNGKQVGPFSLEQVQEHLRKGWIDLSHLAWIEGTSEWIPLRNVLASVGESNNAPPPIPTHASSVRISLFDSYDQVPWYRKSSVNSIVLIVSLLTAGLRPGTIFVCLVLLTGNIYYNQRDSQGKLRVWSSANKVVAGVLLAVNLLILAPKILSIQVAGSSAVNIEQQIAAEIQKGINENTQQIFNQIHPTGTAKNIEVHDVTITSWKRNRSTRDFDDVAEFTVRYTLYWRSPLIEDGYTKISQTWDNETKRYVNGSILATNGMTNGDALELMGAFLQNALNNPR